MQYVFFDKMLQRGLAVLSFKHTVMGGHATLGVSGVTRAGAAAPPTPYVMFLRREAERNRQFSAKTDGGAPKEGDIFSRNGSRGIPEAGRTV